MSHLIFTQRLPAFHFTLDGADALPDGLTNSRHYLVSVTVRGVG